jgi:hypothetical protein
MDRIACLVATRSTLDGTQDEEIAVTMPAAGQPVSFAQHIKPCSDPWTASR